MPNPRHGGKGPQILASDAISRRGDGQMHDHRRARAAHSAFTFLEYFADRDKGHRIDLGKLPKASKAAARRSYVYRILADRVYEKERS